MYQTGEQVWAGLAHEIIKQTTDRMSWVDRERFWLELNLRRIDEQAVRRKVYGLVVDRVLPTAVGGVFLAIAGVLLWVFRGGWLGGALALGGPGAVGLYTALQAVKVLRSNVTGGLSSLITPATELQRFAGVQLKGAYSELVDAPDYRRQAGTFNLIHEDVARVVDLIASPERPLVVFVDDLDRCAPSTVVQLIEAVNLFIAGQYPNVVFVIAMEPEMVAAHIEAAYADLVKRLADLNGSQGRPSDLGWKFLEKIVHLPLALPTMEPGVKKEFYESLFQPPPEAPGLRDEIASEAQIQAEEHKLSAVPLSDVVQLASERPRQPQQEVPDVALTEALRRTVERRLTSGDPEVKEVIQYATLYLDPNPREIKRFVRVFRFYVMIYMERRLRGLPGPASLKEVAKLGVLAIRWPGLMACLGRSGGTDGRAIFDILEQPPRATRRRNEGQATADRRVLRDALTRATVTKPMRDRLLDRELCEFMKSAPMLGAASRGYL
jgi:hypothetical protein